ncbi:MAG: DUF368 domain-containing protein [Clostridia bacterium]|nr:DUF368 domain-containing protein [Clostridia bacterium]
MNLIFKMIQGALIGAGALLPGVSGGVLAVLFGVYKPLMRLLAHPVKELKNTIRELWPILVGFVLGYLATSLLLEELLNSYKTQSLSVFIGMTIGIMPSLFREAGEKGRSKSSFISLCIAFAVAFAILYVCNSMNLRITDNFFWYMFGGASLAISIIVPGMSSSILMLPFTMADGTNFYANVTGAIGGILKGEANFVNLIAIVVGAVAAVVLLTKAVDYMMNKHYSVMFHGIVGVVIASTLAVLVLGNPEMPALITSFTSSVSSFAIHIAFVVVGCVATLLLDKLNSKVEKPEI